MKVRVELKASEAAQLGLDTTQSEFEFEIPTIRQTAETKGKGGTTKARPNPGITIRKGWPIADESGHVSLGGIYLKPRNGGSEQEIL